MSAFSSILIKYFFLSFGASHHRMMMVAHNLSNRPKKNTSLGISWFIECRCEKVIIWLSFHLAHEKMCTYIHTQERRWTWLVKRWIDFPQKPLKNTTRNFHKNSSFSSCTNSEEAKSDSGERRLFHILGNNPSGKGAKTLCHRDWHWNLKAEVVEKQKVVIKQFIMFALWLQTH